jgi:hypothetical protein
MEIRERKLKEQVATWPHISTRRHRFGGREFRFGKAEVGHVHAGGTVDIPFTRAIRDVLLEEGLAEKHFWLPDSGWTTLRIRSDKDLERALWLMRLSYLRYALKTSSDPHRLWQEETERLHASPQLASLLAQFVATKMSSVRTEPLFDVPATQEHSVEASPSNG